MGILLSFAQAEDAFLPLTTVANMGFKDEIAGDGRGGWSDQGPENDFANFDFSKTEFGGIPFRVLDPSGNGGKAVMTFQSSNLNDKIDLNEAILDAKGVEACYLYVLHTCCFGSPVQNESVGSIQVKLKDGTLRDFSILNKREVADWWNPGSLPNGGVAYTKPNGISTVGVYVSKFKISDTPQRIESVRFKTVGKAIWIVVGATLSTKSYDLPLDRGIEIKESNEWKPVDLSDLVIEPGSALDFSKVIPAEPVGVWGRVIVNKEGNFAFEKKPDANLVFCANSSFFAGSQEKGTSKESIKAFVNLMRRQGYNMVRVHFLDYYLMGNTKADLEFNEQNLDNFDYYIACLKESGIYVCMDGMSTVSGFKKGSGWDYKGGDLKKEIVALPEAREHYKAGVTKLLTHLNPYTKTRLVDDPIVVVMNFFNELEFYSMGGLHPAMASEWQDWLKHRYHDDISALATAWGNPSSMTPQTKFEDLPLSMGDPKLGRGAFATDLGLFMLAVETRMNQWFEKTVREIGYQGLITAWDMGKQYRSIVARAGFPVVTMHNYYGHPNHWLDQGSCVEQNSSINTVGQYWRACMGARFADRPYIVTEYGHAFWSQTRYEEGLLFGAYSALQGLQGCMVHFGPVDLHEKPLRPFNAGSDPVSRANQVMSAFLLGRGDVAPSRRYIELRFDDQFLNHNGSLNRGPGDGTLFALICRFGVWYEGSATHSFGVKPEPIAVIKDSGGAQISMTSHTMDVVGASATDKESAILVASLKEKGLLPPGNLSDPAQGIYQSDTGEILMESRNNTMTVITPRFEGIATDKTVERSLGQVKNLQSSVPCSTAVISLDGAPLKTSEHLLLVYNTDALNSGMKLSKDHTALIAIGSGPVLMRTGQFKMELENDQASKVTVWALGFNGKRVEKIPYSVKNGELHLSIDTSKLEKGPTPFFEITTQQTQINR